MRDMDDSSLEVTILEVFREILKQGSLEPDDDFFDSGGDSLLAADATIRLSEITGSDVEVALLVTSPTAREFAIAITGSASPV